MVPVGATGSKSVDSTLSSLREEAPSTPVKSVPPVDDELLGPLHKQPSWASSPDLSFVNDRDADEDQGDVSDLYGSLLKAVDADLDSELTSGSVVLRRRNNPIHPSTINAVSNRVINRLSNVISKGQADIRARLGAQPTPKEFRRGLSSASDADQTVQSAVPAGISEDPERGSSHESLSSQSLAESLTSNSVSESPAAFERQSSTNASYRRLVVPACPSMVTSNMVHVQSSKALIIVSGGAGYRCWNRNLLADSPSVDDSCLLLWKC